MKSFKLTAITALVAVIGLLFIGCHQPEYLNPYGEGVDPATIVTQGFQSRPAPSTTDFKLGKSTTTSPPTKPTKTVEEIPEGYILCPECNGQLKMCMYCKGTDRRQGEMLDPDSGIYKRYYIECAMCSREDPGYDLCPTCHNQLIIKK